MTNERRILDKEKFKCTWARAFEQSGRSLHQRCPAVQMIQCLLDVIGHGFREVTLLKADMTKHDLLRHTPKCKESSIIALHLLHSYPIELNQIHTFIVPAVPKQRHNNGISPFHTNPANHPPHFQQKHNRITAKTSIPRFPSPCLRLDAYCSRCFVDYGAVVDITQAY